MSQVLVDGPRAQELRAGIGGRFVGPESSDAGDED